MATSAGVLLGLNPLLGLLVIFTWILVAVLWRISSLSAMIAALLAPIYAFILFDSKINVWAITTISLLLLWRHKQTRIAITTHKNISLIYSTKVIDHFKS